MRALLILVVSLSVAVSGQCVPKIGDKVFDLTSSLAKQSSVKSGLYTYNLNLCGVAKSCNGTICQFRTGAAPLAVIARNGAGLWSYIDPTKPKLGIQFQTKTGDRCWGKGPRVATVRFTCNPAVTASGAVFTVVSDTGPSCSGKGYEFAMVTSSVCDDVLNKAWGSLFFASHHHDHHDGMSGTWKFNLFVLLVGLLYLGLGCLYNKHMNGVSLGSKDAIPNKEFWASVPNLVSEGCAYSYLRARTYISKDTNPYAPLSNEEDESKDLLGDDEEDDVA